MTGKIYPRVKEIFEEIKDDNKGKVADYIPQLANVDENLFSLCIVSVDGQVLELGNTNNAFNSICSKPITYGIALENYGDRFVHNFIGKEPSESTTLIICVRRR